MKIAVIIVRVIMGLLFLNGAIGYFFKLYDAPAEMPQNLMTYMSGISVVHLMDIVKAIELVCGILLIAGRFVSLASIALLPITFNILLLHAFTDPKTIGIAIGVFALNLFLLYAYRKHYTGLFVARRIE
jgi:uncharacterized membrane protein YphA (DoxX/SURF4 family)